MKSHEILNHQQKWKHDFLAAIEQGMLHSNWLKDCKETILIDEWIRSVKCSNDDDAPYFAALSDNYYMMVGIAKLLIDTPSSTAHIKDFTLCHMRVIRNLAKLRQSDDFMTKEGLMSVNSPLFGDMDLIADFETGFETSMTALTEPNSNTETKSLQGFIDYLKTKPERVDEDG